MAGFLRSLFAFLALNVAAFALFLAADAVWVKRHVKHTWETEHALLVMPQNQRMRCVLLGSSHAKVMTGTRAVHAGMEDIFGGPVLNMAVAGGGVLPALVYLNLFYDRGNEADVVLYFIDPWNLFRREWNEDNPFHLDEPFSLALLKQLWIQGFEVKSILMYLKRKVNPLRLIREPFGKTFDAHMDLRLESAPAREGVARLAELYGCGGTSRETLAECVNRFAASPDYRRRAAKLEEAARLALSHGSRLVFVIPPTLFPEDPALPLLLNAIREMEGRGVDAAVIECSGCVTDPALYYHVDHLNARGALRFASEVLAPAVASVAPGRPERAGTKEHP